MTELIMANWWLIAIALLIGIAVAWSILVAGRKTRVITTKPDVLDEGAEPARRNQALIDAAPAVAAAVVLQQPEPEPAPAPPAPPPPPPAPKPEPTPEPEPEQIPEPEPEYEPEPMPEVEPMPFTEPEPPMAVSGTDSGAASGADALTRIKGLGPKLEKLFHEQGVTSFAQIAAWNDEDIDRIDATLGAFEGRIRRDNFVEQARLLGQGDIAGFERKFGAL